MNIKRTVLLVAAIPVLFTACKKESVLPLTHLAITGVTPTTPTVDQPFTVTVELKDKNNQNQSLGSNVTVTLSLASGNGTLSGDLTATMVAPDNIVHFTNVKYDKVESGVAIRATCTGGYTATISPFFTVTGPMLVFKFKFDSTQARLNNFGLPAAMPVGHWGQSPKFNSMSAHYIELARTALDSLGHGEVLYRAPELTSLLAPWYTAIDFDQSVRVGEGAVFFSMPLKNITPGTYTYLRISLAYQNYDIKYRYTMTVAPYTIYNLTGTLASFIGYNTHINSYVIKTQTVDVNDDKVQGYWGFETTPPASAPIIVTGQASGITVPNPINSTSPIPPGSCVVTGAFETDSLITAPLTIPTTATHDIIVTVSVSTNQSFEWIDTNGDHVYDSNETPVDMGVRGIIPIVHN